MNPPVATGPSTEARIGEVVKRLREQSGLSLRSLAANVGFSASFLSQLENGQVSPSISSLGRIVAELGVSLADLFEASTEKRGAKVVRAAARPGFTSTWSRARVESLTSGGVRAQLEAIAVTLEAGGASGKHPTPHSTDQIGYLLKGRLTLILENEELDLEAGDCVTLPRRTAHRWVNNNSRASQVLLVSTRLSR